MSSESPQEHKTETKAAEPARAIPVQQMQTATFQIQLDPLAQFLSMSNKPNFYANGFQAGLTHSECYLIFNQNNAQKVAITLPYSAVKSLKAALGEIEKKYEAEFGVKILSVEELAANKKQYAQNAQNAKK